MKKGFVFLSVLTSMVMILSACGSPSAAPASSATPAASTAAPSDAKAAPAVNLIAAHVNAESSSFHAGMLAFKEEVEKLSGGNITVEIHPNGELGGNENELVEKMATGTVDVIVAAPNFLASIVPQADLFSIPYLYEDLDHWKRVMSGDIANTVMDKIETGTDFHTLGIWSCGVREYFGIKPINSAADLNMVKIRVHNSPTIQAVWKSLGAQPTSLAYNELYQGLQNNVIDAAENDLANIRDMKFFEVGKYISMTDHDIATRYFLMSKDKYNMMSDEQKGWIDAASKTACEKQWAFDENVIVEARKDLEAGGAVFNTLDTAELASITNDVRVKAAKDLGVEDLYNQIAALKDN